MSRKYFESVGRMHSSIGKRWHAHYKTLPDWARESIVAGYTAQMTTPGVRLRAKEMAADSIRRGERHAND